MYGCSVEVFKVILITYCKTRSYFTPIAGKIIKDGLNFKFNEKIIVLDYGKRRYAHYDVCPHWLTRNLQALLSVTLLMCMSELQIFTIKTNETYWDVMIESGGSRDNYSTSTEI